MLTGVVQGRFHQRMKLIAGLLMVVMLLQPGAMFAQGDGTPPVEAPPPPVEEPPAPPIEEPPALPVEEPPAPPVEEPPAPPVEEVPAPPPAEEIPPAEVVPSPTPTEIPAPTAIPAPAVTCVQEGAVTAVSAGQVVEFRCDYTQGPLKPVIFALSSGWQYSITGATPPAELVWQDRLDVEFPIYSEAAGSVRIFLRATETAVPALETVKISFRAADHSAAAPASEVHLQVTLAAPTPTPEPAIAFVPSVGCSDSGVVGSGEGAWSVRECTALWKTENMVSVDLTASTNEAAWQVVAVDSADAGNAAALDANDGALTLTDSDPNDTGFYSARFSLGSKIVACSTASSTQVSLTLNAASHMPVPKDAQGNPLQDIASSPVVSEVWTGSVQASAATSTTFQVNLVSASFSSVDIAAGGSTSSATFILEYTVPVGCEWEMTLSVADLVSGSDTIPISNLMFTSVNGVQASMGPSGPGTVVISPMSAATTTSGKITITGVLEVPNNVAFGDYRTTATGSGVLLP